MRFRDDRLVRYSPDVTRYLPLLRDTIRRYAITFVLREGQGYVINNHRWLHARNRFRGQRVMYRVTADALPTSGIRPGFVPLPRSVMSTPA